MSSATAEMPRAVKVGVGIAGLAVVGIALTGGLIAAGVVLLALLGAPLFAVMGGSSEILWMLHPDQAYHHLRFVAPTVLDERFADNPVVVTIPLKNYRSAPVEPLAGIRRGDGDVSGVCSFAHAIGSMST